MICHLNTRVNDDNRVPCYDKDISAADLEFFVYPFADKEIAHIPVTSDDHHKHYGMSLADDELSGRVYVRKVADKSSVHRAIPKSVLNRFKGSYITHINNTPVFDVADCTAKLQELYQQHLAQKQGVGEKEKFAFELTFAPEPKLQGEKLKKAIDDFHNYTSGTTKQIKSKPDTVSEDLEILDAPTEKRYDVGTKIYKVFDGTEYKGSVMGYNNQTKLVHVLHNPFQKVHIV